LFPLPLSLCCLILWQENSDGSVTTVNPVGEKIEYKYKDSQVKVLFTKLTTPGHLTIKEVKLSSEQKEELGAITDTAYDISSDMQDGTFTYDLTLPNPDTSKDVQVKYSEDGNTFQNIASESKEGVLVIKDLNHFTVFVTVVNPTPPPTFYQESVIDNGDAEYFEVGSWSNTASCAANAYGDDGRYASNSGSKTATWQISVPQTGHYKIYFYDTGLRNALINNFEPIEARGDAGQLFGNFIVCELLKYNCYGNFGFNFNYWRTKGGSEVDLILSKPNHDIIAVEIKSKQQRINQAFVSRYPKSRMVVIARDNYWV